MSSFSGLAVGLSALYAQRQGLETAGHNIANVHTEGYSRQRVRTAADGGPVAGAVHSVWTGTGQGVDVQDVQRLRDSLLEARALQERGSDAQLRGEQVVLSRLEAVLSEPSDNGLQSQLSDFWAGWDDVANAPTDLAARSQLLERAGTLASGLDTAVDRVDGQWAGTLEQAATAVDEINAAAASVAEFNRAIVSAVRAGLSPNDLQDARDLLVQRLGELAGVRVRPGQDGAVDVLLGDRALVSGRTAVPLQLAGAGTGPAAPDVQVVWAGEPGGTAATGGQLRGLTTALNDTLPRHRDALRDVADRLHDVVNAQHSAGFDLAGRPGGDFFTRDGAGRLVVAVARPDLLAASSAPGREGTGDAGGGNALLLAGLDRAPGGPDESYRRLVVSLGVEAQTANRRVAISSAILLQVDNAREAQAGVDLDEEMTSMLAFQRAYEGAARFVSAVDELLDTLINRTGLVGR